MTKMMKAAVFEAEGKLVIKEVPIPVIENDVDVLIEVDVCSICGTDVHILSTPPGYIAKPNTILGHEFVGKIVEIGKLVMELKIGDRVVVNPNDYCGICKYCLANLPNHCINVKPMGIDYDGGFAKYVKTSEKTAHKISHDVPSEIAAFAEPLACAINGYQKLKIQPGENVLVIGGGPIGLIMVQLMKASGANVVCSEISAYRREYARKSGADLVVDPSAIDLSNLLHQEFPLGVDVVIDVVGSQIAVAIDCVKRGGQILLFGVNTKAHPQITQSQITFKEVSILGTWLANATFPKAVQMLEKNVLNLKSLVTHTFSLDELPIGLELLRKGEAIEVIIKL